MFDKKKRKEYKIPNYELPAPTLSDFSLFDSYYREEDKSIWLRGVGNVNSANILFLGSCPLEEDVDNDYSFSDPRYLKSGPGLYFKRTCLTAGINIDEEYYTTLCKYPLPRSYKLKPKITDINYCENILKEEIDLIKPKIIVCVGKEAADYILDVKAKLSEIEEAWMYSKQYNAMIYIISDPKLAYYKPEYADKLRLELELLAKHYEFLCDGKSFVDTDLHYKKIETFQELKNWINERILDNSLFYAVDTEFGNNSKYTTTFKDGVLRSIQFCWKPGHAVFIQFHNENFEWVFDRPKEEVYKLLADYCNQPWIRFIGHNCAADAVWMKNHLGIDVYDNKFIFDTMFAMQTADEYSDLKLEKLAARYTTLGRYDIELILWKKKNKGIVFDEDEGYGRVPTDILFPYGCRDVDATYRLWSIVAKKLEEDGTAEYYYKIKHPFVTEGFTSMSEAGMPFDMAYADKQRIAYLAAGTIMQVMFKEMLEKEANELLYEKLKELFNDKKVKLGSDNLAILASTIYSLNRDSPDTDYDKGVNILKRAFKSDFKRALARYDHWFYIKTFNVASPQQKVNWLFNVKELEPVKTTKNPEVGNSIPWERVLALPESEQKRYTPAADKDTLKIYADAGDDLCLHLLQMNAVNQITKNFLKGSEGGLQKYICSDGYVRSMYFCTESSRPRAVKPNTLQIPRYVTDYIKTAFKKCESYLNIKVTKNEDKTETYDYSEYDQSRFEYIKEELKAQYNITEDITIENFRPLGLRNCFRAPEDYYFVSCDLKTAEVFAIGYLAGDKNLINALTQPDPQFAFKRMPDGTKKQVRIAYIDEIVKLTDDAKDPSLLTDPNDPDLIRDENGELVHPKQDIHWQNCENYLAFNTPREKLDKNKTRDAAGKAASFSIPYGASPQLLERTIKIATGEDPEPGTGQRLIDAYMNSKPDVAKFLEERKREVIEKQYYKSPSGYKRHYILPDEDSDLPKKAKEALISSLQRQNCNIGLQELVAATLSIATVSLMKEFRKQNMKARVICPLYDAIYVIAPFYEVREVHRLLKKCFSEDIGWDLPGGTLHFQTDHETGPSWGEHLTELEEIKLNEKIEKYTQNQTANK